MEDSTFHFSNSFSVTDEVKRAFDNNGFVVIKNILSNDELIKLKNDLENDSNMRTQRYTRNDGNGRDTITVLWKFPGNDTAGYVARSDKFVTTMEKLLGGEVYHYHSKVIIKEPNVGGAFVWHQDYGYWYENGCLLPNMGTAWLAVDKADRENGCLQILKGSHKAGRIETAKIGDQVGTDLERLEHLKRIFPLVYCELSPGDCMMFHCNLLHYSAQNHSDRKRWAFLVAYNRADNNPVKAHHLPFYTPLKKLPNSAIMEGGEEISKESCSQQVDKQYWHYRPGESDFQWQSSKTTLKE